MRLRCLFRAYACPVLMHRKVQKFPEKLIKR